MIDCRLPHLLGDVIAGLTVGLTVVPQSIAFAKIALLPPQVNFSFRRSMGPMSDIQRQRFPIHVLQRRAALVSQLIIIHIRPYSFKIRAARLLLVPIFLLKLAIAIGNCIPNQISHYH